MKRLPQPFQAYENLQKGLTGERIDLYKRSVKEILEARDLIHEQKEKALAGTAVNSLPYPPMSDNAANLLEKGVICLLGEGAFPFHPRYVAPDYQRLSIAIPTHVFGDPREYGKLLLQSAPVDFQKVFQSHPDGSSHSPLHAIQ